MRGTKRGRSASKILTEVHEDLGHFGPGGGAGGVQIASGLPEIRPSDTAQPMESAAQTATLSRSA